MASDITGASVIYAGGGGGCGANFFPQTGAPGGSGGGGKAGGNPGVTGPGTGVGTNGTNGLGGGGGGGGFDGGAGFNGGGGGSGIVIVSYPGTARFTGGTITSVGGRTIHRFTASGTLLPV